MDFASSPICYLVLVSNVVLSYKGFQDPLFVDKHLFKTGRILHHKEYDRLFYSGFLHADWMHLFFNMYSLYSFGTFLEASYGTLFFSCVYFLSLFGGNLLSLFLHRDEPAYAALGASGAVCGVIFSSILAFPGLEVSMFFIPIGIPGWLFAVLYTLYSIYGIRTRRDNIGHDAHLGGAIIGTITTLVFQPYILEENALTVAAVLVPSVIFLFLLVRMPHLLGVEGGSPKRHVPKDDQYNQIRAEKQKELDRILDKINKCGMESLDDYEKRFLDMNQ